MAKAKPICRYCGDPIDRKNGYRGFYCQGYDCRSNAQLERQGINRTRTRVRVATCGHCQTEFQPKRITAKFCSPGCRLSAHRNGASSKPKRQKISQSPVGSADRYVQSINGKQTHELLRKYHYADRLPQARFAFGIYTEGDLVGCITYGVPASYTLCHGICGHKWRKNVLELTRLCITSPEKNLASFAIARSLALLKTAGDWILVSYADPNVGHVGYVYQSTNWLYTGESYPEPVWLHPESGEVVASTRRHIDKKAAAIGLHWKDLVKSDREGKYRYVTFTGSKQVVKRMRADFRYESFPYPKGETKRFAPRQSEQIGF